MRKRRARQLIGSAAALVGAGAAFALAVSLARRPVGKAPGEETPEVASGTKANDPLGELRRQYEREAASITRGDVQAICLEMVQEHPSEEAARRQIAALYSQDPTVRLSVLEPICLFEEGAAKGGPRPLPDHRALDALIDLVGRRDGLERAYLLSAIARAGWRLPLEGEEDLRRTVSARILRIVAQRLPQLTLEEMRGANLRYVLPIYFNFKLLTPADVGPWLECLLSLMGVSDPAIATQALRGAGDAALFVPHGKERFTKRIVDLWGRNDLAPPELKAFRLRALRELYIKTESDAPAALMERVAFDSDGDIQDWAFHWMQARAERLVGKANSRRTVYEWILKRLASDDSVVRVPMARYVARHWGIVEANWLRASPVTLHLEPDEAGLLKSLKPVPVLLRAVLERNDQNGASHNREPKHDSVP